MSRILVYKVGAGMSRYIPVISIVKSMVLSPAEFFRPLDPWLDLLCSMYDVAEYVVQPCQTTESALFVGRMQFHLPNATHSIDDSLISVCAHPSKQFMPRGKDGRVYG